MLKKDLELIVQYPENRGYKCRGFYGLRLPTSVYIVVEGAAIDDQPVAAIIGKTFCEEVLRYTGATEEQRMPCDGQSGVVNCHAMHEPTWRKILVRPTATGNTGSTASWPSPSAEAIWGNDWPEWQVIPTMPMGTSVPANVPPKWQGINACFWTRHPIESLWAVMQRAGLAPEESRLFISYVRRDTTALADQLFESLTQEGFDVFLDRCSVPVGVQFQERLMQDLCDKAMVVLLNSANVDQSHWIKEEIAIVKSYRLGLLELRFPGGKERPDIDCDFTRPLSATDLVSAGDEYPVGAQKLSAVALTSIVNKIKEVHGRALHRRRYELIDNFAAAMTAAGKNANALPDGTFLLPHSNSRNETVVSLSVRPPELGDFCSLHHRCNISSNRSGWLVSPAPFFLAQRQAHVSWLGGLCNIQHANEAQIIRLAAIL